MTAVLDTNVVLYWLAGRLEDPIPEEGPCISVITEMELLSYPFADLAEESGVRSFLRDIEIVQLTREIKEEAIRIRREVRLKLPDAIIAATSTVAGCALFSTDDGMARVSNLDLVRPAIRMNS